MLKNLLVMFFVTLTMSGCAIFAKPPGKGARAEAGFNSCRPIVEALESYKRDSGNYPGSLSALNPKYLLEVPTEVNGFPIRYKEDQQRGFVLSFSYTPPGMNECVYEPANKWKCRGWY